MSCPQGREARNRDHVIGFATGGILGVVPSPLEVIGVFPSLSATVMPHRQEIKFRRGDSFDLDVQVQNDQDPPSMVDISRSVMRFGAKQGYGVAYTPLSIAVGNEGLQVYKSSALASEIEYINATSGQARIKIRKSDTYDHPLGVMAWDIELTQAVEHLGGAGTLLVVSGQQVVQGIGTDFLAAGVGLGDIIHVDGLYLMILQVLSATSMIVDYTGWTTGSGLEYNLYRGSSKTIASGPWNCVGDVVI